MEIGLTVISGLCFHETTRVHTLSWDRAEGQCFLRSRSLPSTTNLIPSPNHFGLSVQMCGFSPLNAEEKALNHRSVSHSKDLCVLSPEGPRQLT